MNSKLCKKLRRQARKDTIGAPAVKYKGVVQKKHKTGNEIMIDAITIHLDPASTKGRYRELKKQVMFS